MKLGLSDLKSLQVSAEPTRAAAGRVDAIFKVRVGGYVPAGVEVRTRVSKDIFTGSCDATLIERLRKDAKIVSVEESERLRQIG